MGMVGCGEEQLSIDGGSQRIRWLHIHCATPPHRVYYYGTDPGLLLKTCTHFCVHIYARPQYPVHTTTIQTQCLDDRHTTPMYTHICIEPSPSPHFNILLRYEPRAPTKDLYTSLCTDIRQSSHSLYTTTILINMSQAGSTMLVWLPGV